jgi:hypothetical protein
MSKDRVRLQNLRDFTVQIRRPSDETVVGTGIAASMDRQPDSLTPRILYKRVKVLDTDEHG